jgi:hypothetical protein
MKGSLSGEDASGTATFTAGASGEVLEWSGTLSGRTDLSGTFSGTITNGTTPLTVDGSFSATSN